MHITQHGILLKVARGHRFFPLQAIVAAEAKDRYAELILLQGERCPVFHSLGELETRLGCGRPEAPVLFWRVHRRFIVGLNHAMHLTPKRRLVLSNGEELPVSREQSRALVEACGSIH